MEVRQSYTDLSTSVDEVGKNMEYILSLPQFAEIKCTIIGVWSFRLSYQYFTSELNWMVEEAG